MAELVLKGKENAFSWYKALIEVHLHKVFRDNKQQDNSWFGSGTVDKELPIVKLVTQFTNDLEIYDNNEIKNMTDEAKATIWIWFVEWL